MTVLRRVALPDAVALVGVLTIVLGVGLRVGWDVALIVLGLALVGLALLIVYSREETP